MQENLDNSDLVDILLDFGEGILMAGGEISRVEDSLSRMGVFYGAVSTNVFVITSSIELTVRFEDGQTVTRTRRIRSSGTTDFEKLSRLNALSRRCAVQRLSLEELRTAVDQIRLEPIPILYGVLGSFLAAAGFAVFFGGTLLDAAASGLFGLFIFWLQCRLSPLCSNKIFFLFVCSLMTSVGICLVQWVLPELHIDKVLIGDIMLIVPGIAITTAVRDTLIGDTISGVTRLADCLVWAAALAAGVMIAISLFAR